MKKILTFVFAVVLFAALAVSASARVAISYDLEEVSTTAGAAYKVVATLSDDQGDFRGFKNDITFDYNLIKPVNKTSGASINIATSKTNKASLGRYTCTYYDEDEGDDVTVTASWGDVTWTVNEDGTASLVYEVSVTPNNYPADGMVIFEMTFMLASGKTVDDLQSNSFVLDYIAYRNGHDGGHYYGSTTSGQNNDIILTNNVVPAAPVVEPIYVPVVEGDKVYLQDGTFAIAEATGDYEVPATVGYVAVNSADDQETYYVDGTSATLVHTNGIVSTSENNLRGPDETYKGEDRSGLRFRMNHNPLTRETDGHEVAEIGVLMTVESDKVKAVIGQDTIDNLKVENVCDYVKSGYALGNGYDRVFDTTNDDNWIISAVMYNIVINEKNVTTNIVCRPFYKVGDTYIYGETMKATLYDVASTIKAGGYVGCSDELKNYVDTILAAVDGWTEIIEEEIVIDIFELYN